MDIAAQAEFYQVIEEIREQKNCAILIISHDLHIVMQKTNQVVCINRHICCEGSPESINNHPEYLSLFGKDKIDNITIYSHHHDHKHWDRIKIDFIILIHNMKIGISAPWKN